MDPTDGYLRAYDDDLGGALELAIADVVTADIDRDDAARLVWASAEDRLDHVGAESGGETALWVINALQEQMIEDRSGHVWPACPDHPSHPLWIEALDSDARWTCEQSGRRVARLGELSTVR
jgi:hypothetical protein